MRRSTRAALLATLLSSLALAGCASKPGPGPAAPDAWDRSVAGLPTARAPEQVRLADGASYRLTAAPVAHDPGAGAPIRMFAYNGQVPGPTLRVPQGASVAIELENRLPFNTTLHGHGVRLDAAEDGVPGLSQPAVPPGGTSRYRLRFPDEGVFWYHPHVREDTQQDLGLAGLIIVDGPRAPGEAWPREQALVLDDFLVQGGDAAPYGRDAASRALTGRFGNVLLANGRPGWEGTAAPGERVRLYVLDAANARTFRLSFPGAQAVQWIAADGGYLGTPRNGTSASQFLVSPGERLVLDVLMPERGSVTIRHSTPDAVRDLGWLASRGPPGGGAADAPESPHARARASLAPALARSKEPAQATWELDVRLGPMLASAMPGGPHGAHGGAPRPPPAPIEWEDPAPDMNANATAADVLWIVRDAATGSENMAIQRTFERGSVVNVLLRNLGNSSHPMQHPIHLHGQRFVVASVGGVPNDAPAWKDTVLVPAGSDALITVDMANPGRWLFHCHISEHLEAGMMGTFTVA